MEEVNKQMVVQYGFGIVFGILAVIDCKRKWFRGSELLVAAGLILIGGFFMEISLWNRLAGGAVGLILVGFSILSREQFGKGDSVLLLCSGISMGLYYLTVLLMLAFGMSAVIGIALLLCKKIKKSTKIPFVPFLFVAQLIMCLVMREIY